MNQNERLIEMMSKKYDEIVNRYNEAMSFIHDTEPSRLPEGMRFRRQELLRKMLADFYPEAGGEAQPNLNTHPESIEEAW